MLIYTELADIRANAEPLAGDLSDGEQDLFRFTVGEAPELYRFRAEGLEDTGGALALFKVETDGQGRATKRSDVLRVDLQPLQPEPGIELPPRLLAPGQYVLGIGPATVGRGEYSLTMETLSAASAGPVLTPGIWEVALTGDETCLPLSGTGRMALDLHALADDRVSVRILDPAGQEISRRVGIPSVWTLAPFDPARAQVCVKSQPGRLVAQLAAVPDPAPDTPQEVEPNDTPETAQRLQPGDSVSGRLDERGDATDADVYVLAGSDRPRSLAIRPQEGPVTYILRDAAGTQLKRAIAPSFQELWPIAGAEDLFLTVSLSRGVGYRLDYVALGPQEPGAEAEPNDTPDRATPLPVDTVGAGELGAEDHDVFAVEIPGPPQLWRVQADGGALTALRVLDAAGRMIAESGAKGGRLRVSNLYLLPGRHFIELRGSGAYALRLLPQGPRLPGREVEPNSDSADAEALTLGDTRAGLLDRGDRDVYRLSLRGDLRVRLQVQAPFGEPVRVGFATADTTLLRRDLGGGASLDYTRDLPAGDYEIAINGTGDGGGLDDYTLTIAAADDQFPVLTDQEPNDFPYQAGPMPRGHTVAGAVGEAGDGDLYRLADLIPGGSLTICDLPTGLGAEVLRVGPDLNADPVRLRPERARIEDRDCRVFAIEGAQGYLLSVTAGSGAQALPVPYEVTLEGDALVPVEQNSAPIPVPVGVLEDSALPGVRAYLPGQTQRLAVPFAGGLGDDRPLHLAARFSEPGWRAEVPDPTTPGALAVVIAPPDAPPGAVLFWLRGDFADGGAQVVQGRVTVAPDAAPLDPRPAAPLPPSLHGGLDVASAALGGRILDTAGNAVDGNVDGVRAPAALIDGHAVAAETTVWRKASGAAAFTFALAEGGPHPVAGFVLVPRAGPGQMRGLRNFRVEASDNGTDFTDVLFASLTTQPEEQAFVLPEPVLATHLRLIPLDGWSLDDAPAENIRLAAFKAIAPPGYRLPEHPAFNIADPTLGGHVVWSEPPIQTAGNWEEGLLVGDNTRADTLNGKSEASLVIGFHHARIARLHAVDWIAQAPPLNPDNTAPVGDLRISVSTDGPLGPWRQIAAVSAPTQLDGQAPIVLEARPWARYVKFDLTAGADAYALHLPDQIRIWEDASHPSILGEWGEFSDDSAYPPPPQTAFQPATGGASRGSATPLVPGKELRSAVQRGRNEDWWQITAEDMPAQLPAELALTLQPDRAGAVRAEMFDAEGHPIALIPEREDETGKNRVRYLARIETAGPYAVRVFEPKSAIMVAYDTSGSTAPYRASLSRALRDIARAADPDHDLIDFLPFGGDPMGPQMTGDPEVLLQRLTNHAARPESSNAEDALRRAALAVGEADGTRGVILMTDGATGRDTGLWAALRESRPMVAALAIPSAGAFSTSVARERDLMEDWANVADGLYVYVTSQAGFLQGFERAIARMRAPKSYAVSFETGPARPMPPGRLQVTSAPPDPGSAGGAADRHLMILLDNSGSMLRRLDGKRRYEVAQEALIGLAEASRSAGTTVGLRVFGVAPDTCETALVVPPGEAAGDVVQAIRAVRPQNLARTPIADALLAARGDLTSLEGERRLIVLTDGEETCDGDPGEAIAGLVADGISARVDIVGFQIDDATLTETFRNWARIGGGAYFDAQNAAQLSSALAAAATTRRFTATAANGDTFDGIVDGEPIDLPAGSYTLSADAGAAPVTVLIRPEETTTEVLPPR